MKKAVLTLLLFAGLFFIFDKLFLLVAFYSARAEADKRLEYLIQGDANKDIVIVGSSRGARDIIACQIENQTDFTAYNICYPGSNMEFHEFIVRTTLKYNNNTDLIILVVDDDIAFKEGNNIIFRKDRLYPLVKYKYIWEELAAIDSSNRILSSLLVVNRLNKYNFDLRQKSFTEKDTIISCGSMPISWKSKTEDHNLKKDGEVYSEDDEVLSYILAYKRILKSCLENNVDLLILFPPILREHSKLFENRVRELSNNQVEFFIYNTENPIYSNEEYFHDGGHLLTEGARIFTQDVIQYLNESYNIEGQN